MTLRGIIPLMLIASALSLNAVPARPVPIEVEQPDGTVLTVQLFGDEYHHFHIAKDGAMLYKGENEESILR